MRLLLLGYSLLSIGLVACGESQDAEPELGVRYAAINGGTQVASDAAAPPYMIRIGENLSHHYCGGVLLTSQWFVTAAHCVDGSEGDINDALAIAGDWRLDAAGSEQARPFAQILVHPSYDPEASVKHDDIALVRVSSPFTLSARVAVVGSIGTTTPTSGTVYGWGMTYPGSVMSPYLRTAALAVIPKSTCQSKWAEWSITLPLTKEFCAWNESPYRSVDKGDSGGPFVTGSGASTVLRGITSKAYTAGGTPGVFVDIKDYASWINENVFDSIWLDPVGDTWASSVNPDANYGSAVLAEIKYGSSDGYLLFDLYGIGDTIVDATLWQTCYQLGAGGSAPVVQLRRLSLLGELWDEDTLTWNNRPTSGTNQLSKTISSTALTRYAWNNATLTATVEGQRGGLIAFRQYVSTSATRFARCATREAALPFQPVLQLKL